jgi:hypothetical protein
VTASLGEDAQCFRGSISIAGRRPIRHFVAISAEVAKTRPGADRKRQPHGAVQRRSNVCAVPGCATVRAAGGTGLGRLVHRRASPARCNQPLTWTRVFASPREGHKESVSEMDRKGTPSEANPVPRGERAGPLDYPVPGVVTQLLMFGASLERVQRRKASRRPGVAAKTSNQLSLF